MNGDRLRSFVEVAILSLVASAVAAAQHPQKRAGLWVGVGTGYGGAKASCDNCASGSWTGGVTGFVRAGGTLGPSVRLGGTLEGWTRRSDGVAESMTNLAASVSYYPIGSLSFFVTGGLGVSRYRTNTSPVAGGTGWGVVLGIGYDLDVSRRVSLSPGAGCAYSNVGNVSVADGGGTFARGWRQGVLHFELGVTFHR